MNPEWFAGRLRELREQAGLSREQLAQRAGLKGPNGIRNLEQGIRRPAWETVLALCTALDVPCDAFTQPPGELAAPKAGRPRKPEAAGAQAGADRQSEEAAAKKKATKKRKGK